jgi:hypothetical protein
MNNNIGFNFGNQIFVENNNINNDEKIINTLVEQPQKIGHIIWTFAIALIGILADAITIFIGLNQIKKDGLADMLINYKLIVYIIIFGIISVPLAWLFRKMIDLITKRASGKYILKDFYVYKFKLKTCPVCGDVCNGKLKLTYTNDQPQFICNRDKMHNWKINYYQIVKMAEDIKK